MTHKHGGNIYEHKNAADFSANINFLGMPDSVRRAALDAIDASIHYPEPGSKELRQILAKRENVSADQVICGNGAAELMFLLAQSLRPKHAVLAQPCFFEYEQSLQAVDCQITNVWLRAEDGFELTTEFVSQIAADADLVILGNPNNPTGRMIPEEVLAAVRAHCREHKIWLVADESFFDFLTEEDAAKTTEAALFEEETVFVIKSFTKMYAMPGLRVGYGICRNTALMEKMRLLMQPWNVSLPAQMAAKAAAEEKEFAARTAEMTAVNRGWMTEKLRACGYTVFPSCTNYLLFSGPAGLVEYAVAHGYLIRDCSNFRGLETNKGTAAIGVRQEELMFGKTEEARQYYRICIRSQKENEGLLAVLEAFLEKKKGATEWQKQS